MQNKLETLKGKEMWKHCPFVGTDSYFSEGWESCVISHGTVLALSVLCSWILRHDVDFEREYLQEHFQVVLCFYKGAVALVQVSCEEHPRSRATKQPIPEWTMTKQVLSAGTASQEDLSGRGCSRDVLWGIAEAVRDSHLPGAHLQRRQELKSLVTLLDSYLDANIQTEMLCAQLSDSLTLGLVLSCWECEEAPAARHSSQRPGDQGQSMGL